MTKLDKIICNVCLEKMNQSNCNLVTINCPYVKSLKKSLKALLEEAKPKNYMDAVVSFDKRIGFDKGVNHYSENIAKLFEGEK